MLEGRRRRSPQAWLQDNRYKWSSLINILVYLDCKLNWKKNTDAVFINAQSKLLFSRGMLGAWPGFVSTWGQLRFTSTGWTSWLFNALFSLYFTQLHWMTYKWIVAYNCTFSFSFMFMLLIRFMIRGVVRYVFHGEQWFIMVIMGNLICSVGTLGYCIIFFQS